MLIKKYSLECGKYSWECSWAKICVGKKFSAKGKFFFFNWDSFHARLNSHYTAWSYKKKKHKKIKAHRKSV